LGTGKPEVFTDAYIASSLTFQQETWLAENAVSEEDRFAAGQAQPSEDTRPEDPMQGLEGLDVAGPKPE
jgi:hypothetical protein